MIMLPLRSALGSILRKRLWLGVTSTFLALTSAHGALFTNAKVVYVDTRSSSYGSTIVIQLVDAPTGQALNLCGAATGAKARSYVAILLSDLGARLMAQSALLAKATGLIVIGNTLEAIDSHVAGFCQIGNFGVQ